VCGIAGIVSRQPPSPAELERISAALAHRGPDDHGLHVEPGVALVHRRLSILDRAGGHQPMASADGRMHIVFNGEIYNYRELRSRLVDAGVSFRTESDPEVVLAL
jgi:asparagine synthase (glutamine-hydrolysing)